MSDSDRMDDTSILMYVDHGCSCESYFRYVCGLCRAIRDQHPDFKRLLDEGFIVFDQDTPTYHTQWRLTAAGRERCGRCVPAAQPSW